MEKKSIKWRACIYQIMKKISITIFIAHNFFSIKKPIGLKAADKTINKYDHII